MRIDHIALWTTDLERSKRFYAGYFGAAAGADYLNPAKGFTSCFLSFSGGTLPFLTVRAAPGTAITRASRSIRTAIASNLRLDAGEEGRAIFDCLTVWEFTWE